MIFKASKLFSTFGAIKSSQRFHFCTTVDKPRQLSYLCDRAFLASNVMKIISMQTELEQFKAFRADSLHKTILKYLKAETNVDQNARNHLLQLFESGIQLKSAVWSQKRFKDARMSKKIEKIGSQEGYVIFYPTRLVTSQIFRRFLDDNFTYKTLDKMITGNFEISKSFSVALFAQLSNMIAEFNFKKQINELDQGLRMRQKRIINAPKVAYINFNDTLFKAQSGIRKLIFQQLSSEVPLSDLENCLKYQPFVKKQANFSPSQMLYVPYDKKSIPLILIIDQISQYFSLLRRVKKMEEEEKDEAKRIIFRFKRMINSFLTEFQSQVIYLSSMDIQRDLIEEAGMKDQQEQVTIDIIQYPSKLREQESIQQIIQIFLNLYQQQFKTSLLNDEMFFNEVKKTLYDILSPIRNQYFTNFLFIREQILKWKKSQKRAQEINSRQELKAQISNIFKATLQKSIQELINRFKTFVIKRENELSKDIIKEIIFEIYNAAEMALRNQINIFEYQISLNDSSKRFLDKLAVYQEQNNIKPGQNNQSKEFKNLIFRQFLKINQQQLKITSQIPAIVLKKSLQQSYPAALSHIMKEKASLLYKWMKRSGKEESVQLFMIQIFKFTNYLRFVNSDLKFSQYNHSVIIRNIKKGIYGFQQIKKDSTDRNTKVRKQKNWNFLESFEPDLSNCILSTSSDVANFLFLPKVNKVYSLQQYLMIITTVLQNTSEQKLKKTFSDYLQKCKKQGIAHLDKQSINSKAIDFAFVQVNNVEKKIKINAFDVTISRGQEVQKLTKFIDQFSRFSDREQRTLKIKKNDGAPVNFFIQLGYYVISPLENSKRNIETSLNKAFSQTFSFEGIISNIVEGKDIKNQNMLDVKAKDPNKKYYLKKVGCFDIFTKMKLTQDMDQKSRDLQMASQLLQYFVEALEENLKIEDINKPKQDIHRLIMKEWRRLTLKEIQNESITQDQNLIEKAGENDSQEQKKAESQSQSRKQNSQENQKKN